MSSFRDLKGIEGIDKLNECIPYVDEILSDKAMFDELDDKTWFESAGPVYKKHTESIEKLFEILGDKPETAAGILSGTARLLVEIFQDKDLCSFFMGACKNMRSVILAMANTKEEPSQGS